MEFSKNPFILGRNRTVNNEVYSVSVESNRDEDPFGTVLATCCVQDYSSIVIIQTECPNTELCIRSADVPSEGEEDRAPLRVCLCLPTRHRCGNQCTKHGRFCCGVRSYVGARKGLRERLKLTLDLERAHINQGSAKDLQRAHINQGPTKPAMKSGGRGRISVGVRLGGASAT